MSSVDAMPLVKCGDNNPPSVSPAAPASVAFRYTQTDSFVALQQQLGASLVVSTYHANKLLVVRRDERLLSAELLRPKRSGGPIQITQTVSGCSELSTTPLDFLISKNL